MKILIKIRLLKAQLAMAERPFSWSACEKYMCL